MEIQIKKKNINLTIKDSDLISVQETADGLVFNLKEGFHIHLTDLHMPNSCKGLVCNTVNNFKSKKIILSLDNYSKPVMVEG